MTEEIRRQLEAIVDKAVKELEDCRDILRYANEKLNRTVTTQKKA